MLNDANVSNLMKSTMENLKDMIDVNTVIGDAVTSDDGTLIIPVSKLSFGFISGGSEYPTPSGSNPNDDFPFGGGSSAGVSVKPIAFLIVKGDNIRLLHVDSENPSDKIVDVIPQVLDIIKNFSKNKSDNKKESEDTSYGSYTAK